MTTPTQCHQRVPDALWPWISAPPRCTLTGPGGGHHGDHRSSHTVLNVGKMTFKWRGMRKGRARPDITLPTPTASHINPARGKIV